MSVDRGHVILLNGTSSAGKTTLATALRPALGTPFCYYASDQLADAGFRSRRPSDAPPSERQRFFDGFHRSIPAFASAGNNLLVEHIIEEQSWADDLRRLLDGFDVYWIGLHAPEEELVRREQARGNRHEGEAVYHLKTHQFVRYDLELDAMDTLEENVTRAVKGWTTRDRLRGLAVPPRL